MEMKGEIESVEEKQANDGSTFRVATINKVRYSIWDPEIVVEVGNYVKGKYTQKGKYKNIQSLEPLPGISSCCSSILSSKPTILGKEELKQIMGDTLVEVSEIYEKLPLNADFKEKMDWSKITLSLFIAKTKVRQ